jgi:hypothetical protein
MNTKKMREELREAGKPVPRSNKDLEIAYAEFKGMVTGNGVPEQEPKGVIKPVVKLVSSNIYTYIGAGDEPPHMINFMGLQNFVRGQPTEVNNPEVIEKVSHHACFVKGEADTELMFKNDELEKKKADEQRHIDACTQIEAERGNKARG